MSKVIYHVAISIDGFIAQEKDDIDLFLEDGAHVSDYLEQLKDYDISIMGRRTYEFGYRYGMKPGDNPYSHMETYVYSKSIEINNCSEDLHIIKEDAYEHIANLRSKVGSSIYLCGGGIFATNLLEHKLIDEIILKINPVIIGSGIALFTKQVNGIKLLKSGIKEYENGVTIMTYQVSYE